MQDLLIYKRASHWVQKNKKQYAGPTNVLVLLSSVMSVLKFETLNRVEMIFRKTEDPNLISHATGSNPYDKFGYHMKKRLKCT